MTEPEERGAGWRMNTGFAGNADATASATSGADRSMTEPEEHGAGWRMLTAFASEAADATACAASGADRSMTEPEERLPATRMPKPAPHLEQTSQ